jgi:hypothetical protein
MNNQRYNELMDWHCMATEPLLLTEEEIAEGWHFCYDWDYLLVGPGMSELEACGCGE